METTEPSTFAEMLRHFRDEAGFTQEELAERAGLSPRGVAYLERGARQPYRDTMRRLADALALTEEDRAILLAAGLRTGKTEAVGRAGREQAPPENDLEAAGRGWVYVAHAQGDHARVDRLRADLQDRGITSWLDQYDLPAGTPSWEQALRDAIRGALAVLLIASPHTRSSRYVADELRIAELYGRRVYPIWVEGEQWMECVPLGWGGLQYLDARGDQYGAALDFLAADVLRRRAQPVGIASAPETQRLAGGPRNPYKGLRAFGEPDAQDFFGRERLVDTLVASLATAESSAPRFLALLGPSGSGKSSVVLAGLLPRLRAGALSGSERWIYLAPITPGSHPLDTLAQALCAALPGTAGTATLRAMLAEEPDSLHRLARQLVAQQGQRVVLVVDQSEELFAVAVAEEERRCFIEQVTSAATSADRSLLAVLTLRADFYNRPMRYPLLGNLLQARASRSSPPRQPTAAGHRGQLLCRTCSFPSTRISWEPVVRSARSGGGAAAPAVHARSDV